MNISHPKPGDDGDLPELAIPPSTVRFLIDKLREYDAQGMEALSRDEDEPESPFDASDYDDVQAHETDYLDEPLLQELRSFMDDLSDDEKIDLVAIAWTGRNGLQADDWPGIRQEAADSFNDRSVDYLLGTAGVANLLDDGLAALGYASAEADEGDGSSESGTGK